MPTIPAGLLLHESVLSSYLFKVFALVVAFNTLIYLGLTLSKFMPWPRQTTPRRVRLLLGMEHEDHPLSDVPVRRDSEETYEEVRLAAAVRSATAAFALLGVLLVVVGLLSLLLLRQTTSISDVSTMAFGLAGLISSVVFTRSHLKDRTAIWTWVTIASLFVMDQSWQLTISQNPLGVAGISVVLLLTPAIALSWLASLVGGLIAGGFASACAVVTDGVSSLPAVAIITASFIAGVILMFLRISSIDEATSNGLTLFTHGTTDGSTGLLSRDALEVLAPVVFTFGEETARPVAMTIVTIDDFVDLDDDYGWDYGDDVMRATGERLRLLAPPGALIGRWSGSRLAMLAVGDGAEPRDLSAQLAEGLRASGVALGKRPITVTCRVARHEASEDGDLDALISRATSVPVAELRAPAD